MLVQTVKCLRKFFCCKYPVSTHLHQIIVEVGEGVPGWTHSHFREVNLSDGEGLDGGEDWVEVPTFKGLLDQGGRPNEARGDDKHPEAFDWTSRSWNVRQTMNSRGLEKLRQTLHTFTIISE